MNASRVPNHSKTLGLKQQIIKDEFALTSNLPMNETFSEQDDSGVNNSPKGKNVNSMP